MISGVFAVLDKAINAYLPPFFCRSRGEAIRSFTEACSDDKHQFARHALDYVLVQLGEFDDSSGFFACGEPVRVLAATEVAPERDKRDFFEATALNGKRGSPM